MGAFVSAVREIFGSAAAAHLVDADPKKSVKETYEIQRRRDSVEQ
jgi:hypothetical protein